MLDTKIYENYDPDKDIAYLTEQSLENNYIDPKELGHCQVKRGLRNADGTGVVAGVTNICNVHGYVLNEGNRQPVKGQLVYRGIDIEQLVKGCEAENRFGFEEIAWLLLYGKLPTTHQLAIFNRALARQRELPDSFIDDAIIKLPSSNLMNALQRSTLALYSYDENPEENTPENIMRQSISLIAKMPILMTAAYQVKRRVFDKKSMYFHHAKADLSISENILRTIRSDKKFTDKEAKMLDLCLVLHAEHGGGNNSTFSTRVLSSTGTDTYSAISAGIGSLKGPKHGGANAKVMAMISDIKENVSNWKDATEVGRYLEKILNKEAGDLSGLVYGMGHAIYTLSDPRAVLLKQYAEQMVEGTEYEAEYRLIELIETLTPDLLNKKKGTDAPLCANVDLYSGMVYTMLGIPPELITPLFAIARTAGWCAHRMEEVVSSGRIMRPAYRVVAPYVEYTKISDR